MRNLTDYERGVIEGACKALWWLRLAALDGDGHCKSYDPGTVDGVTLHSYVFDLPDGGRHHDLSAYESAEDVVRDLVTEMVNEVRLCATEDGFYGTEFHHEVPE